MGRSGSASGAEKRRRPRPGTRVEVDVVGLDAQARGIAADGTAVTGALPGEKVLAEVEHVSKAGAVFGRTVSVLASPSPDRVPVACPRFLVCGGCDLLHASAALQHAEKRARVAEALGVSLEQVSPVLAGERAFGYRGLAKLVVGPDGTLGSYRPWSHEVTDMAGCVVHAPAAERVADALRAEPGLLRGVRYVLLRASFAEERVVVTLVTPSGGREAAVRVVPVLRSQPSVARVELNLNDAPGDALLGPGASEVLLERGEAPIERIGPVALSLAGGAFSQVNPSAAAALYAHVSAALGVRGLRVLDLYSASGALSLTMALAGASEVTGVELNAAAVAAARRSAEAMGLADRVSFVASRVEDALSALGPFEAIVLNPPRKGVTAEVVRMLAARAPVRFAYVSCNPRSLARDLAALRALVPVAVASITPVDLFPHTLHVETVVVGTLGA